MLTENEKSQIKLGVGTIMKVAPDATVDQAIETFLWTFGNQLTEEEQTEAKAIIRREYFCLIN